MLPNIPPRASAPAPASTVAGPRREERRSASRPAKVWVPPPKEIVDTRSKQTYTTGDLLGEGGFARVYHVQDEKGTRCAVKVVPKTSLRNPKTKNKLLSEVDIHRSMRHRHIVRFHAVFEDQENVYMILELCENKSLMDMLKKRKRLSEPEARYFFWQILDATRYMHDCRVIHRDLKLGNVFLSRDMHVKIGDFGLAAHLEDDEERKKTICGTPNYIAPEILFDTEKGHSYEVDAWSLGVILYTMLFGRPPFQTKDVKEIYKKIRENVYEFPRDVQVSDEAQELIRALLCKVPESRLSASEIVQHPFFTNGPIPERLSSSALLSDPGLSDLPTPAPSSSSSALSASSSTTPQTGSAISSRVPSGEPRSGSGSGSGTALGEGSAPQAPRRQVKTTVLRTSTLGEDKRVERAPQATVPSAITVAGRSASGKGGSIVSGGRSPPLDYGPQTMAGRDSIEVFEAMAHTLDAAFTRLHSGRPLGEAFLPSLGEVSPSGTVTATAPAVFVAKWMDYSNKYGLGYELTDGSVAVYFNDATIMARSPDRTHLEYLYYPSGSDKSVLKRLRCTTTHYPPDLQKKVTLLGHFSGYMAEHLYQPQAYTFDDLLRTANLDFLSRYVRVKEAVVFRLSNHVVQINFFKHYKLILSDDARTITLIDTQREMRAYTLPEALASADTLIYKALRQAREILGALLIPKSSSTSSASSSHVHPTTTATHATPSTLAAPSPGRARLG